MSYEQKVDRARRRGCWRSVVITLAGGLIGIAMLATTLWVLGGRDARPGTLRIFLAPLVSMVFVALVLFAGFVFVYLRGRRLDRAFRTIGLEGHQVTGVLRGWHGSWRGRQVDAWFSKGPMFEIYLDCAAATRAAIHRPGRLLKRVAKAVSSREPIEPTPAEARDCTVYGDDPDWLRQWLAAPQVEASLHRLLEETERVSPMIRVTPNAVHYSRRFIPRTDLSAENLERWLGDLEVLAAAADELGPSATAAETTRMEQWARHGRGRRFFPIFYGCLSLFTLAVLTALYAFFVWTHRG